MMEFIIQGVKYGIGVLAVAFILILVGDSLFESYYSHKAGYKKFINERKPEEEDKNGD